MREEEEEEEEGELTHAHVVRHPLHQVGERRQQLHKGVRGEGRRSGVSGGVRGVRIAHLDGALHVVHVGDGGEEDGELDPVGPGRVHGVHGHVGGGAHGVAHVVQLGHAGALQHVVQGGGQVIPGVVGLVLYGMVRYGMVWYGTVWYGMVWYGMVWYGMVAEAAPGHLVPGELPELVVPVGVQTLVLPGGQLVRATFTAPQPSTASTAPPAHLLSWLPL